MEKSYSKNILYIAGYPNSGSTILLNVLNEITGFIAVGEIKALLNYNIIRKKPCGCGSKVEDCEYWAPIISQILIDSTSENIRVLNKQRREITNRKFHKVRFFCNDNQIIDDNKSFFNFTSSLYKAVFKHTDCKVLVDSSKDPMYAWFLSKMKGFKVHVIHLVRDPRGTSYSLIKKGKKPNHKRWIIINDNCSYLSKIENIDYHLVKYEDFASNPANIIEEILKILN